MRQRIWFYGLATLTLAAAFASGQQTTVVITTTSLPNGNLGVPYSQQLSATSSVTSCEGDASITWFINSEGGPGLPSGLTLNEDGSITGTPDTMGSFSFTVEAFQSCTEAYATRDFTITIDSPLVITTTSLPSGSLGVPYSPQQLTATGSSSGLEITWSIVSGSLPGGLSLSPGGIISGTPGATGLFSFTVQASQSMPESSPFTTTKVLSILVGTGSQLTISTSRLPSGIVGAAYSQTLISKGAVEGATLTWTISSGSLPTGLALSEGGVLSGSPTVSGSYVFLIQVTSSTAAGVGESAVRRFTLEIVAAPLQITTSSSLPPGSVGVAYSQQMAAMGGAPAYAWSISSGALPDGVGLNSSTGVISGTPASAGTFSFQLAVTDQAKSQVTGAFTLAVTSPLSISTASPLPAGGIGAAYSTTLSATGGATPYTWSISSQAGSLPPGVTLDAVSGHLAGTPASIGSYGFQAIVTDAAGRTASKAFTLSITNVLAISTTSPLPDGAVGAAYQQQFAATGGTPAYTWSIAGGALPAGITLDPSTGLLSGTPTAGGAFNVTIGVKDASQTASSAFRLTITVPTPPVPSITGLPDTPPSASQPTMGISLSSAYTLDLTGHATLAFVPDTASDDPAVQFTTGGRSADFQIPAGSTQAVFGSSTLGVQTGTVAGTITITLQVFAAGVDVTPTPPPTKVLRIAGAPPVITSAKLVASSTGFNLVVIGYSTTREVTGATVHLTPATDAKLATSDFTIQLTSVFATWYQDAASIPYGSQFSLSVPFAVEKVANVVASLTVTLTNSQGTSTAATATF
jgi:large repetitive protein